MAGNTKRVQNAHCLPGACDLLRRMSAQAVGRDGRTENKQTNSKSSPHTEKRSGMGTMKAILPSILSFISSRRTVALDGKGTAPQETLETLYEGASHTPTHTQAQSVSPSKSRGHLAIHPRAMSWSSLEAVRALRFLPKGTATPRPPNS